VPFPILITVAVFIAACMIIDVRERRIPNVLSGVALLAGTVANASYFGVAGALSSLVGSAVGALLLLGPCALGGVGAGDVKMLSAIGALVGPGLVFASGLVGMVLGGVVMTTHLLRIGRLGEIIGRLGDMIGGAIRSRSVATLRTSTADPAAVTLPYSVPLGIGTVVVLLWAGH
jgi:prepilin peptidase CpaA